MLSPWRLGTLVGLLAAVDSVLAIGQATCVAFKSAPSTFPIVSGGSGTPIFLSDDDWPGVQRAAIDFAMDIQRVTGVMPSMANITATAGTNASNAIIVGTLGRSSLIDAIVNNTKLDVSSVQGQWESFLAKEVKNPLPGIDSAYVMIGADKRGTIFSMYDHSEQFGVSPWYWWADVPSTQHSELFVTSSGCAHASPTVKYRGIFLNDEQPALQNWAFVKFTNGTGAALTGSPFNQLFYTKLYELILRLKGNYLWPAQWSSAFAVDDHLNQVLADWYGIAMGTSHEEPMTRSTPVEWTLFGDGPWDYSVNMQNIYNFWLAGTERAEPYENVYTMGMRGDGDEPLAEGQDIGLLEQVISDQRGILSKVFNTSDVTTIPQMWCLYKEVEGFYDDGMTVPDDITLLWTDDNWGNIRRFPTIAERNRTGGAGVYYHFDYVGDPRDFKWITSSQLSKTYEEMSLTVDREATRIWIVNVGDLKPYEMDIEFFLTLGWNASIWNPNNVASFVNSWAEREFGMSTEDAATVASILANVTRFNARRKPELLNSTVYSLVNYREAEQMLADWQNLNTTAVRLYNSVSSNKQPAFFQLVLHPVQASATLGTMWIFAGINNLRASQARVSANEYKTKVEELFETDFALEEEYHSILDGKWSHMMDQTHVVYAYWQQPMHNTMPLVTKVQQKKQALTGPMRIALENSLGAWPGDNMNDCAAQFSCGPPTIALDPFVPFGNTFIDIGAGGPTSFTWNISSNVSWLQISPSSGSISPSNPETRVFLSVDWSNVSGAEIANLNFLSNSANQTAQSAFFLANKTVVPDDFHGFVEGDGGISIEAAHTSRNTSIDGITWIELPEYGRTLSAITPWPRGGDELNFTAGAGPHVEYDFYNFNTIGQAGNITVNTVVAPTFNNYGPSANISVAVSIDDLEPQTTAFFPTAPAGGTPPQWDGTDGFVADSFINVPNNFTISPGAHTLKIWMTEPTVVVQKIIIDTGGVRQSYLGPPESIRV
ncbi:glycoside hydrolase family 115 protein [Phanerochaete carnosa HHB-10118-sp]|uniref:Glycoside hydrolase family 115 protein n=1 Tax=Phanerochaete carnosa (strain HHB-10118-sp) TaxID=650164 RepID=K5VLU1_PHACS|nr:glycoside hydrolase family 115 protein [Phanerochaete carnosa HHB-10118-sp]EKM52378.1 glycoside hydrolase family 115 protein [Phanerochaete carnosa HHB-10118-sp]